MKNVRKIISCLLCFILLLCCSSGTLAADTDGTAVTAGVERVTELTELRTANSDTYLMSDGTYQCEIFAENKYFLDEQGEY